VHHVTNHRVTSSIEFDLWNSGEESSPLGELLMPRCLLFEFLRDTTITIYSKTVPNGPCCRPLETDSPYPCCDEHLSPPILLPSEFESKDGSDAV
jgi:hypothetical protein